MPGLLFGWRFGVGAAALMLTQMSPFQFIDQGSGWAADAVVVAGVMVASLIWNQPGKRGRSFQLGATAALGAGFVVAMHVV